jgi:hypothetical protein
VIARGDERRRARVDRGPGQRPQERSRLQDRGTELVAVARLVGVQRRDDEVCVLLGLPDAPQDPGDILLVKIECHAAPGRGLERDPEPRDPPGAVGLRDQRGGRLRDGLQRVEEVLRHQLDRVDAQRAHPRAARRRPRERQRVGRRPVGRGERDQPDPSLRGLQVARCPGQALVLAGSRVHQASRVEPAAGLPHALDAPVQRVIVRAREQLEAECGEVLGDPRVGGERPVVSAGVRVAGEPVDVNDRGLEVAVRRVGRGHHVHDGGEAGIGQVAGQRPRSDAVADRGQRERFRYADLQLGRGRPSRVEALHPRARVGGRDRRLVRAVAHLGAQRLVPHLK